MHIYIHTHEQTHACIRAANRHRRIPRLRQIQLCIYIYIYIFIYIYTHVNPHITGLGEFQCFDKYNYIYIYICIYLYTHVHPHTPGIGEFQCFDKYMLEHLKLTATVVGKPDWGVPPGSDLVGTYNSMPWDVPFFKEHTGAWADDKVIYMYVYVYICIYIYKRR